MPKQIIKDGKIENDNWAFALEADDELPTQGDLVVSTAIWNNHREALIAREGNLGIFLNNDEEPESIADDLTHFQLIAINFPTFMDGRGYSVARLLRERYNFQADVRAVGEIMQDQLLFLSRCGFSSFALKEGKDIEEALAGFNTISDAYQAATDEPNPLYRRRV